MYFKKEKGATAVDIVASVVIITMFIGMISGLVTNINYNIKSTELKNKAMIYAVQEIEKIKAQGIDQYTDKGITEEYVVEDSDIYADSKFTGYHKKATISDYVLVKQDSTKQSNILKVVNVEISYRLGGKDNNVTLSTYITKK